MAADQQHGWQPDPFGIHEQRYFSQGQPTKLVKDGTKESYDPPPPITSTARVAVAMGSLADLEEVPSPVTAPSAPGSRVPATGAATGAANSTLLSRCSHCRAVIDGRAGLCPTCRERAITETIGGKWANPSPPATSAPPPGVAPPAAAPQSPAKVPIHRQWWPWVATAVVALAIVVVFVHGGSPGSNQGSKQRGKGTHSTSTLPVSTTTTVAVPVAPQPSPAVAANALVSGWASGNKPVALSVATPQAVATLFSVPYPGSLAISRGCSSGVQPIVCTYGPSGGASPSDPIYSLSLLMAPHGGWYVSSVQILR